MNEPAEKPQPFLCPPYALGLDRRSAALTLDLLQPSDAARLGAGLARINPWAAYGVKADEFAAFLGMGEPQVARYAIRRDAELAGVVVVRYPWLLGPYLNLLALLPHAQGHGIGSAVLRWMEAEARSCGARNAWLCVTSINTHARAVYEHHGYRHVADLDALVADHLDEILMRKRLSGPGS